MNTSSFCTYLNNNWALIIYIITLTTVIGWLWVQTYNKNNPYGYVFNPTEKEINETLEKLKKIEGRPFTRTLDDERAFMEDLFVKRFNYLLLVFSIFFAGANNIDHTLLKAIVLLVGGIFCYNMAEVVKRAHYKHHWIMRILYGLDEEGNSINYQSEISSWENHPVRLINEAMKTPARKKITKGSISLINGYFLPNLSYIILFLTSLYFFFEAINQKILGN